MDRTSKLSKLDPNLGESVMLQGGRGTVNHPIICISHVIRIVTRGEYCTRPYAIWVAHPMYRRVTQSIGLPHP